MSRVYPSPSLEPDPNDSRTSAAVPGPEQPRPWHSALKFALKCVAIGLVAGVLAAFYQMDVMPAAQLAKVRQTPGGLVIVIVANALQTGLYLFISALFGWRLATSIGLLRPWRLARRPVLIALAAGAAGGVFISLDKWTFNRWIPQLQELTRQINSTSATEASSTVFWGDFGRPAVDLVAQMLYGGFVEEILVRLFLMSLFAWIVWKVFWRKNPVCPTFALVVGNVVAAAFFAAGHLPATYLMLGALTPLIIVRTFLFNGAVGLLFGWLYRKYGLQYAMVAHAFTHLAAGVILALF